MPTPAYKRILLKLSGEALMGDDPYGINRATIVRMVREVQEITRLGCEVAVVIGCVLLALDGFLGLFLAQRLFQLHHSVCWFFHFLCCVCGR